MTASVTLKNGATVPYNAVTDTMTKLRNALVAYPLAVYELALACDDPARRLRKDVVPQLKAARLLEADGEPCGDVRDVILSAITINAMDLTLDSPVA